jgi:ribonuclease T1
MAYLFHRYSLFFSLFLGILLLTDCQSQTRENQTTKQSPVRRQNANQGFQQRGTIKRSEQSSRTNSAFRSRSGQVPQKVYDVLTYVRANRHAMQGYVGGRRFGNFENHLPRSDADGKPIRYQEWDVNPKVRGRNRGTERLITGSDGRAWYTNDHYNSFVEVK